MGQVLLLLLLLRSTLVRVFPPFVPRSPTKNSKKKKKLISFPSLSPSLNFTKQKKASVAFFDDSTRNIAGAAASGIFSVLVGRIGLSASEAPGASAQVSSVLDLPTALPSLWTRHGAEPPSDLLRGGRLRSEEEVEADEARAREAASGRAAGGETAEQVRNALSSSSKSKSKKSKSRGRRRSSAEESRQEAKSPVLAPA